MARLKSVTKAVFTILLLLCVNTVFAEEIRYDGYYWERMNSNALGRAQGKLIVSTLLKGYSLGFMLGKSAGMPMGMALFYKSMGEHGITIEDSKRIEIITNAVKAQLKEVPDPNTTFPKPSDFYYDELTSFYQAYPLCKGITFDALFLQLARVWANWPSEYKSLKDVGENCHKLEK
jgi:hypothetical protein